MRAERQIRRLTAWQLRHLANQLEAETAHRGIMVRFSAALQCRQLRDRARQLDASKPPPTPQTPTKAEGVEG